MVTLPSTSEYACILMTLAVALILVFPVVSGLYDDKDVVSLLLGYTTWNCCVEKTPSKIELISPFE